MIPVTEPDMLKHPIYGNVSVGVWIPIYKPVKYDYPVLSNTKAQLMLRNDSDVPILIKKANGDVYAPSTTIGNVSYLLQQTLASAFPNVKTHETVDHMDNIWTNNVITNLQWLSRSENSSRSYEARKSVMLGRPVGVVNPITGEDMETAFPTIAEAARAVRYSLQQQNNEDIDVETAEGKIRRSLDEPGLCAYGYKWREYNEVRENLEGEEWKTVDITLPDCDYTLSYTVSNKGRVRSFCNVPHFGYKSRYSPHRSLQRQYIDLQGEYKSHTITFGKLIYRAFNGEIPNGYVITINKQAPKLKNGTFRYYPADLIAVSRTDLHNPNIFSNIVIDTDVVNSIDPNFKTFDGHEVNFTKRRYNLPALDKHIPDMQCIIRTKDGKTAIFDEQFVDSLNFGWLPGDSVSLPKKLQESLNLPRKMSLAAYVWQVCAGRQIPTDHVVKPVNLQINDVRIANLECIRGTFRSVKRPSLQKVPDKYQDALKMQYLPKHISINACKNGDELNVTFPATQFAKHGRMVNKDGIDDYIHQLIIEYGKECRDYETENNKYQQLLSEYYQIMEIMHTI
jgi:hypothetical protein